MRGYQGCSRESWKTTLKVSRAKSENWHSDSQKKVQLTLFRVRRRRKMKLKMKMMIW